MAERVCTCAPMYSLGRYIGLEMAHACPIHGADAELRKRCAEALQGIGQGVDMTHPDYCSACDGACLGH